MNFGCVHQTDHVWYRGNCGTLGVRDSMTRIGIGVCLGLCFGAALGAGVQNVAVGVAFGVAIAVAFSMMFGAESPEALAREKAAVDKPLPRPLGL
ncbi:MAG TPA: hypothetical protein VH458_02335 [Vicinamibacterales bacterium]|jgi:hypothetical protein